MIFQRLIGADSGGISDFTNPRYWVTEGLGTLQSTSGVEVSPTAALALSAYFAAMRAISEDIAKLPLITYRQLEPRGKEKLRDHPAYNLLHTSPNPWMSSITMRETITAWALGWGNAYGEIVVDRNAVPISIVPLHPRYVAIRQKTDGSLSYHYKNGSVEREIPAARMLHLHGLGDDGVQGYSVAKIGAESMGLSIAAQRFGASFFGNGAALGGVLTHPETLSDTALKHLRDGFTALYTGPHNAGKPAVLEEGMKFERVGIPPEDAQFLETRQLQVEEVARWFRIPPHKIQHLLRATFSNIESQNIEYVVDTLTPWCVRWEQELKRKLFAEEDDVFAEHVVTGLLRGDHAARGAYYREQFMIGALSQNDIRELENRNPIGESGDVYYVPSNMTRSQDAAEGWVASASGPPGDKQNPESAETPDAEDTASEEDESEDDSQDNADSTMKSTLLDALQPVFAAEACALLRKEQRATQRAATKHKGEPAAFGAWLNDFWLQQRPDIAHAIMPVALAFSGLCGDKVRTPGIVHAWAAQWECDSKARWIAAHKTDDTEKLSGDNTEWHTALVSKLLDDLSHE
jgi:HK97 family phage portal protein